MVLIDALEILSEKGFKYEDEGQNEKGETVKVIPHFIHPETGEVILFKTTRELIKNVTRLLR